MQYGSEIILIKEILQFVYFFPLLEALLYGAWIEKDRHIHSEFAVFKASSYKA